MNPLQRLMRRLLPRDKQRRALRRTATALSDLSGNVATLQGLVHYQTGVTLEALRKAGWQSDEDVAQTKTIQRMLDLSRDSADIIVGPWTGEVGFELLYWIPLLNWLVDQGIDPKRLVVISRGGAAPWYRHLSSRYIDLLDLMTPEEFRQRTSDGKRKQYSAIRELDRELVERVRDGHGLQRAHHLHPATMFRLFMGLWRQRATIDTVDAFTSYRRLLPVEGRDEALDGVPSRYVAVKFYFSKTFPDTPENAAFIRQLLQRVSRQVPVVLMSTSLQLDDHHDFAAAGTSGIHVVDAHSDPARNLERQTRIVQGAQGFIGTYGGFAYLAPFYGVRSVSFFSHRQAFKSHHLELANHVFDRLLPGGFLAMDRQAAGLVIPAVEEWTKAPAGGENAVTAV